MQRISCRKRSSSLGTLDTKGHDFAFVRDLIEAEGLETLVVDFGVMQAPAFAPDISREEVAAAAGGDLAYLASGEHKDEAMQTMATGLAVVVRKLFEQGKLDGIMGMGGGGNTSIATGGNAYAAGGRAQIDAIHLRWNRCQRLGGHKGYHLHALSGRCLRSQQHQSGHLRQRCGRNLRDGKDGSAAASR